MVVGGAVRGGWRLIQVFVGFTNIGGWDLKGDSRCFTATELGSERIFD